MIDGVGSGDPYTTGYSDYASLGQYQITGTVIPTGTQPVAKASASPASGIMPLPVNFSSDGSYDPNGTIASHYWDFADGSNSTEANPSHTYSLTGTYVAVLTVTDNQGAKGTSSPVTISVQQDPTKLPDMIVSSLTTSVSGTSITVKDTTKNQGLSPAAASTIFIYFSNDATLDAGDTLIGSRAVGVLAAGGSSTVTTVLPIPANALPGTRYVIVVADGGNTVGESIENNNAKTKS